LCMYIKCKAVSLYVQCCVSKLNVKLYPFMYSVVYVH
jgi:hypothetical protein